MGAQVIALRTCSKCGQTHSGGQKSYCNPCWATYTREWRAANPKLAEAYHKKSASEIVAPGLTRHQALHMENVYGISAYQRNAMLAKQNNSCAICNRLFDPTTRKGFPHIDHDPRTNVVRGLLCQRCNIDVHRFDKEPNWLPKALRYLRKKR